MSAPISKPYGSNTAENGYFLATFSADAETLTNAYNIALLRALCVWVIQLLVVSGSIIFRTGFNEIFNEGNTGKYLCTINVCTGVPACKWERYSYIERKARKELLAVGKVSLNVLWNFFVWNKIKLFQTPSAPRPKKIILRVIYGHMDFLHEF